MDNTGLGLEGNSLTVPRGRRGLPPLTLDMENIYTSFNKIKELERATPMTLANLMTSFLLGMAQLSKIMTLVELESKDAKRELERNSAIALLEKVEGILEKKKVKSTADTREAALALDPDLVESKEKYDMLIAVSSFLHNKYSELLNAYHAAKKIADIWSRSPDNTHYAGGNDGDVYIK